MSTMMNGRNSARFPERSRTAAHGKHRGSPLEFSRRMFLRAAVWGTCWLGTDGRIRANDAVDDSQPGSLITPAADAAIQNGLRYLADRQRPNGAMGGVSGSVNSRRSAVSALAGLAWLASGSTPDRGPYGEHIDRAIDYLLEASQPNGFLAATGTNLHGPMYDHGFATLFLAEVYGMSSLPPLREALANAVTLIIDSQNGEGGWRYEPRPEEADISVTICQIMALRAARNAGIHVPKQTVERCVAYVKRCQNPDGGFMYMATGGPSDFPRSAAGLVALYSAGIYEGPEIESGLAYLMGYRPNQADGPAYSHFFYGHYYAAQAMWQAGGDRWRSWYPAIRDELVKRQLADGAWTDSYSTDYGTSMACLILQLPNAVLPIFQR